MILDPTAMRINAIAGFTSVRGRSHTFDARADGYARGAAIDAIACRPVESAPVQLSVCGSAIRQDGKSASLTAPNGQAQQGVLAASLADAELGSTNVAVLEAHGTGTALGDPIEAGAAAAVLLVASAPALLTVGSAKANAGHTEPGAGLAGALKLLMQLKDGTASPNAQLRLFNPHVRNALGQYEPCEMPLQVGGLNVSEVHRSDVQQGGVSSFGYAGTIAHALLRCSGTEAASHATQGSTYRHRSFPWRPPPQPLLQQRVSAPDSAAIAFRSPTCAGALHAIVAEHAVQGRVLFPGAGHLELARAVCTSRVSPTSSTTSMSAMLRGVVFLLPLAVEVEGLHIECFVEADAAFTVRSGLLSDSSLLDASVHCSGSAYADASGASWQQEHQAFERLRRCVHAAEAQPLYDTFHALGLQYGPSFRQLASIWAEHAGTSVARLHDRSHTLERTAVHVTAVDAALQLSAHAGGIQASGETSLPFAVDESRLRQLRSTPVWACAAQQQADVSRVSLAAAGRDACAQLDGFRARALKASLRAAEQQRRWLYEIEYACARVE